MSVQVLEPKRLSTEQLREAALGKIAGYPRTLALERVRTSRLTDKLQILEQVVKNESEPSAIRRQAIAALWRINSTESVASMVKAVKTVREPGTQASLFGLLGRVGDEKVLRILEKPQVNVAPQAEMQLAFSKHLLRYRLGLPGVPIKPVEAYIADTDGSAVGVIIENPVAAEVKLCLAGIKNAPTGIDAAADGMVQLDCKAGRRMLVLSKAFARPGVERRLLEGKAVLGLLAHRRMSDGEYFPAGYILCSPQGGNQVISVVVAQMTGEQTMTGTALLQDGGWFFRLRGVDRFGGSFAELEGNYKEGKMSISKAMGGIKTMRKRILTAAFLEDR